jgi:hypothetical protein
MLDKHIAVQWPLTAEQAEQLGDGAPPTSRLYEDGKYQTESGKAKLFAIQWEPFPEQPTQKFPFVLNTGRTVEHWHTRTKTKEVKILERMAPTAWLEMNPRDARKLTFRPHDRVSIISPRGRVDDVELRITEVDDLVPVGDGRPHLPDETLFERQPVPHRVGAADEHDRGRRRVETRVGGGHAEAAGVEVDRARAGAEVQLGRVTGPIRPAQLRVEAAEHVLRRDDLPAEGIGAPAQHALRHEQERREDGGVDAEEQEDATHGCATG